MNVTSRADGFGGRYFLATRDDAPIGVLHVTPDESEVTGEIFYVIEHVYVVPQARREGVGRALLDAATLELRAAIRHDGRVSPTGAALIHGTGVRSRGGRAETLDAELTEDTGAKLLRHVATAPV